MNSSNAIVISKSAFGEADQYIQFLTKKWGMITVLAKSARKSKRRYAGGLDLFCHSEIFIRGMPKQNPYMLELTVLNSFPGLRNSLEKLVMAGKITQWIRQLANTSVSMPEVFSLLGQTLALTETESKVNKLGALTLIFKYKLLSQLGLCPSIQKCLKCQKTQDIFRFDIEGGGILCSECNPSERSIHDTWLLNAAELTELRSLGPFRLTEWPNFSTTQRTTNRLNQLLTDFAFFHTHTKLPV